MCHVNRDSIVEISSTEIKTNMEDMKKLYKSLILDVKYIKSKKQNTE